MGETEGSSDGEQALTSGEAFLRKFGVTEKDMESCYGNPHAVRRARLETELAWLDTTGSLQDSLDRQPDAAPDGDVAINSLSRVRGFRLFSRVNDVDPDA